MLNTVQIKVKLENRLQSLGERVEQFEGSLRAEHSPNFSEQALEREDEEVLEKLELEALGEVDAIQKALSRIDNGNYGVCVKCGDDIDEKRILAVPFASHCIGCAE
ncbi:MAG: TraR/DksA C4-type zinc finger protein [Sneathiella sp.]